MQTPIDVLVFYHGIKYRARFLLILVGVLMQREAYMRANHLRQITL
jgi:hypothetical protein